VFASKDRYVCSSASLSACVKTCESPILNKTDAQSRDVLKMFYIYAGYAPAYTHEWFLPYATKHSLFDVVNHSDI
jgi:hypothetical protein